MTTHKIKRLAIANRGEVAVRIIHACHELGIETILLHSEADVHTKAYRMSDITHCIGPSPTNESYLNIEANIRGALEHKANAIHPGFGFLSENADFADAVVKAGMIFVGPSSESIRMLGDKISAKKLIQEVGLPCVPGYMGEDQSLSRLEAEAKKIGYPVIVKAAAGGGGRGMKLIRSSEEAAEQITSAQREALSSFGSSTVFLEKYLDHAKHIEFQVFGDSSGKCVHLLERECSIQRRHQKIIEEACASKLSDTLRQKMSQAAVQLAERAKYQCAGTVEFLVQDEKFYFLEMNTRLQVEHPITEMVLGVDLVKAQILNAEHQFKIWDQEFLRPRGHAIECRLYAENPFEGGIPSTGKLLATYFPEAPGRRYEVGFEAGDEITAFYDPMIAKIIVWDETRQRAIQKMIKTLSECVVFGVYTNIPYLIEILKHPEFQSGQMNTQFINQHFSQPIAEQKWSEDEKIFFSQEFRSHKSTSGPNLNVGLSTKEQNPWLTNWDQK